MDAASHHDHTAAPSETNSRSPRRCLSCGVMHTNDDFKCDQCLQKENWKPEQWDAYRQNQAVLNAKGRSAAKFITLLVAGICLVAIGLKLTIFRSPSEAQLFTDQGQHYFEQGQYNLAIQAYLTALNHNPPTGARTTVGTVANLRWRIAYNYNKLRESAYSSGDYNVAVIDGENALSYDPSSQELQNYLSICQTAAASQNASNQSTQTSHSPGQISQKLADAQQDAYTVCQAAGVSSSAVDNYAQQIEGYGLDDVDAYEYVGYMQVCATKSSASISDVAPAAFGALRYGHGDLNRATNIMDTLTKYGAENPGAGVFQVASQAASGGNYMPALIELQMAIHSPSNFNDSPSFTNSPDLAFAMAALANRSS